MWCQERSSLSDHRTFQPQRGREGLVRGWTEETCKNVTFWPLNPYYKRSDWKPWLALTSKLWNKKKYCWSLTKWSEIELYSLPMVLPKIFNRSIQGIAMGNLWEKIKSAIPRYQNCAAWLVKNDTVFSKLMLKISLPVSGVQSSKHLAGSFPFSEF